MTANVWHRRAPIEQPGKATSARHAVPLGSARLVQRSVRGERLGERRMIVQTYIVQALALIGLFGSILWLVAAE